MPTVDFTIGHKDYTLACQEGEERLLRRAAAMLDAEAQSILERVGRMPEQRLLLLAGLMLADRAQAIEDRAAATERELARLRTNPPRAEAPAVAFASRSVASKWSSSSTVGRARSIRTSTVTCGSTSRCSAKTASGRMSTPEWR